LALYTHKQCETGNFFSTGKEAKDKQCDNPELTSWACCALKYKWHKSLSIYELVTGTGKPSIWTKTCPTSLCNIHLLWNVLVLNPEFMYMTRYGMILVQKQKL